MYMRFGLCGEDPLTQKEVAQKLDIFSFYISRLQKSSPQYPSSSHHRRRHHGSTPYTHTRRAHIYHEQAPRRASSHRAATNHAARAHTRAHAHASTLEDGSPPASPRSKTNNALVSAGHPNDEALLSQDNN